MNKKLSKYFRTITKDYMEKKLTSSEVIILIYILSKSSIVKNDVNVTTLKDVRTTFKLRKQRSLHILNKLKDLKYVNALYKVTSISCSEIFSTYNKGRAHQKVVGGQLYFFGVSAVNINDK